MGELAVIQPVPMDELFDRAAEIYLDLWDEDGVAPKTVEIEDRLHSEGYPDHAVKQLRTQAWTDFINDRRKEHVIRTMAPRLMAAQLGGTMQRLAGEQIIDRLKNNPSTIDTKDLVAIMKQGGEAAKNIDRDMGVDDGGDKPQVYIDMRSITNQLDDARAFDLFQEMARRFRAERQQELDTGDTGT